MAGKYRYKYAVVDHGEKLEDAREFESTWDPEYPDYIVEDAADYEFYQCDGYEAHWPLTFRLWDLQDEELGVFKVEQEPVPRFTAERIEERANDRG